MGTSRRLVLEHLDLAHGWLWSARYCALMASKEDDPHKSMEWDSKYDEAKAHAMHHIYHARKIRRRNKNGN